MNKAKAKEKKKFSLKDPKIITLGLVIVYWLLDYLMMAVTQNLNTVLITVFTLLAPLTLYRYYAYDYQKGVAAAGCTDVPRFVKNKNRYVDIGWMILAVWGVVFLVMEPFVVPRFFPGLDEKYYQCQIVLMVYIAPIMEEITFRYFLYDRCLKPQYGWFLGFVISSLLFVVTHPVTNLHSFVIYLVPTVLFFLVYSEFGLYGSIVMHMIYNMVAL